MPTLPVASARLLLVDDNNLGMLARKAVLEELGHRVTTASSAEAALGLLSDATFDIVVTDYKLPEMNGCDFIREIRARDLPVAVVLLSGFTNAMGLNETNTGADVVLQKSAQEVNQLLRSVKSLLRRKPPKADGGGAGPSRKKA